MLDAPSPLAYVDRSIHPTHLSKAFPLIVLVLSFVSVSRLPHKHPYSMLLVLEVLSFVPVTVHFILLFSPLPSPVLESFLEISIVNGTICPHILSVTFKLPLLVVTYVHISIAEHVTAFAMFKTCSPLSLVLISIFPQVDSISICFGILPFAYIGVSIDTFPHSITVFETLVPLTFIGLIIQPPIGALPMRFTFLKLSFINVPIRVYFIALAVAFIFTPSSLINTTIFVNHDS